MRKLTHDEVLSRIKEIHGNIYDYSLIAYKNKRSNVTIICPSHGKFSILPDRIFSKGAGCPHCGILKRKRPPLSTATLINRCISKHGDRYDYSLTQYVDRKTKIKIICRDHGVFNQLPFNHCHIGHNCPTCARLDKAGGYDTLDYEILDGIKEAFLYTIRIYNNSESFYKVGVTVNMDKRFRSFSSIGYDYDIINWVKYPSMLHAFRIEQDTHFKLRKFRYTPKLKFGGYTECYRKVI